MASASRSSIGGPKTTTGRISADHDTDLIEFSDDENEVSDAPGAPAPTVVRPKSKAHTSVSTSIHTDLRADSRAYVSPLVLAMELSKIQQAGSVFDYAREVDAYLGRLNWPSSMAIGCFRRGLKPHIDKALDKIPRFSTLSYADVKSAATRIEQGVTLPNCPSTLPFDYPPTSETVMETSLTLKADRVEDLQPVVNASENGISKPNPELRERRKMALTTLTELIPGEFKFTPGLQKPLLWHAVIKYLDSLMQTSHLTPFDVLPGAEASADCKIATRIILLKMIPRQYQPAEFDLKLSDDPSLYTMEASIAYLQRYTLYGSQYAMSETAQDWLRKTQSEYQAILDMRVQGRMKAIPTSHIKVKAESIAVAPEPGPVLAPVPAPGTTKPEAQASEKFRAAIRSQKKALSVAQARKLVKRKYQYYAQVSKSVRGDSKSTLVLAERKVKELNAAIAELKIAINQGPK